MQVQFRIPFPQSIAAAYYVTRASAAWVPKDHQAATIEAYLRKFYQLARRYSGLKYDVERAAALELQYWEVHRRLVGQPDKTDFIGTMIQLHAVVFGLSEADARESAELRVEANNVLDTITGRTTADPAADWLRCQALLDACYSSIRRHFDTHQRVSV